MARGYLTLALVLALARGAAAQLPGPGQPLGLTITANGQPLCTANIVELPASAWSATCEGGKLLLEPSGQVMFGGPCMGDDPSADFCSDVYLTGRTVRGGDALAMTPWRVGTTPPGTCEAGNAFFDTDARWSANVYGCMAPNVWAPPELYSLSPRRTWRLQQRDAIGAVPVVEAVGIDGGVNTVTTSTTADLVDQTGEYIAYTSGAVSGNEAKWLASRFTLTSFDHAPSFLAVIKTGTDLTNARLHVGLVSADSLGNGNIHAALLRYDTTNDATAFWRCQTNDGGTFPGTVTTSSIPILTNTRYVLQIIAETPTTVRFLVNNVLACTHTTDTPTAAQALGYIAGIRTLNAAAKAIRLSSLSLAHD